MDVWGAGCVLFEIITRQPLFPGNNELDQLHKIHDIMGAPSPQLVKKLQGYERHLNLIVWSSAPNPVLYSTRKLSQDYNFPPKPGSGLRGLLSQSSQECLSFHSALLAYDPDERISSKDALKHPFFKDIIKQLDEQNEKKALLSSSKELSIEVLKIVVMFEMETIIY